MSSYYSDDEDLDIHVRRRAHSPDRVRYVQPAPRPRSYYAPGPSYLVPEQRTTVVARSRSRERSRSRDSRATPPQAADAGRVVINNRFYKEHSSSEDEGHKGRRQLTRRRSSYSRSRSRSRYMTREDWEAEQDRRELETMRMARVRDEEERRLAKELDEDAELRRTKLELEDIKKRDAESKHEKRIKRELELERLRDEERAAQEKKRRDKEAKDAVERYKQEELERKTKEAKKKEQDEKEYKRRLQEDLIKSGLDEKYINAIVNKEKIKEEQKKPDERATYTRMPRRHLSIETLRTFSVEYALDQDPEFVLIKRWVPEWEQKQFWKHTRYIREKRKTLIFEEKKHHKPEIELVVRKKERKRSKSPSPLLMYLAGGR